MAHFVVTLGVLLIFFLILCEKYCHFVCIGKNKDIPLHQHNTRETGIS